MNIAVDSGYYFLEKLRLSDFSLMDDAYLLKNKRKTFQAFLVSNLYQLFLEFEEKFQFEKGNLMEYYKMDAKIIQSMLLNIVKSEEYTLEGISYYTRIPFDVIYDCAAGLNNQLTAASWARIVSLYLKINPKINEILIDKLINSKNAESELYGLLNEM